MRVVPGACARQPGCLRRLRKAHLEDQVEAGHLVNDEPLKAEEEDREVVHPLQHRRHGRYVHQVAREQEAQQQHLRASPCQSETSPS